MPSFKHSRRLQLLTIVCCCYFCYYNYVLSEAAASSQTRPAQPSQLLAAAKRPSSRVRSHGHWRVTDFSRVAHQTPHHDDLTIVTQLTSDRLEVREQRLLR